MRQILCHTCQTPSGCTHLCPGCGETYCQECAKKGCSDATCDEAQDGPDCGNDIVIEKLCMEANRKVSA